MYADASRSGFNSIEDLFFRWLVARRMVKTSTALDYCRHVRRLAKHGGVDVTKIRARHLEAFLEDFAFSWRTKNVTLIAARVWHRWGADRNLWKRDVDLLDTRLPRRRIQAARGLTTEEARRLLSACRSDAAKKMALLGLYQGLRLSEILDLRAGCWTIEPDGEQRLMILDSKGGKDRTVPVHEQVETHRDLIIGTPVKRKELQAIARQMRDVIGRFDLVVRLLRTTYSQALVRLGIERAVIGELLGHSPSGVTQSNYAPVTWPEQVEAQRVLSYGSPYGEDTRGYL